jgi:very-short-patch-repair endonuclease
MYWSKNKERKFSKIYPTMTDEDVAKILRMPIGFVKRKAEELSLEKVEYDEEEWATRDIEILQAMYPTTRNRDLSKLLGKELHKIEHFAYRLGLRKTSSYSQKFYGNDNSELVRQWEEEYEKSEHGSSKGNYVLGKILNHLYPNHKLFDEEPIGKLRIDWYMPEFKLAFEFQGLQHTQHVEFFHKTKYDFNRAQERDYDKSKMCEQLGISLIAIYHDEELSIALIKGKIDEVL